MLNQIVAARRGDHLWVVDVDQDRDLPDRGAVPPQLIGVNDFWDIVLPRSPIRKVFAASVFRWRSSSAK